MLAIVNVSAENTPPIGLNNYEVRINDRVIATFTHERKIGGAAQCLRDAADAVERCQAETERALRAQILERKILREVMLSKQNESHNAGLGSETLRR